MKNIKCGAKQKNLPASTSCTTCINNGLECCETITKTCQNQGIFCHAGAHKVREDNLVPVACAKYGNYGDECCETKLVVSRNKIFLVVGQSVHVMKCDTIVLARENLFDPKICQNLVDIVNI